MRLPVLLSVSLLVAGCAPGEGAIFVTVGASGMLHNVDHFHITIQNANMDAAPIDLPLAGRPVDIPPPRTFQLRFDKSRHGATTITIVAVDAAGTDLAHGSGTVDLEPSQESPLMITLGGTQPPGDGGPDSAPADVTIAPLPDLAMVAQQDMAVVGPADMTIVTDGSADAGPADMTALPPPTITSVSPQRGPTVGGTALTINGNNFFPGASVTVDGAAATKVKWLSSKQLTATLPAKPGAFGKVPVMVTNPDGQSTTDGNVFSYFPGTLGFLPARQMVVANGATALAVGDYNGDKKLDLAVATGAISIFLGNGDGTFGMPVTSAAGIGSQLASADLNGDGMTDLAGLTTNNGINVLLASGNGHFLAPKGYLLGFVFNGIAAGDFSGDGILDLVVANYIANAVSALIGSGGGSFKPAITSPGGMSPGTLAVADFNLDGNLDVAAETSDAVGDTVVDVLLGNGAGSFRDAETDPLGRSAVQLVVGDLAGTGRPYLASVDASVMALLVLKNDGTGKFPTMAMYATEANPSDLALGDLNSDGALDVVVVDKQTGDVSVLLGNGDGTLRAAESFPVVAGGNMIAVGDFDRDGRLDIATATASGAVAVILNNSK